jgi:pimeloyl-ACP methyl ester carboxylesterase
MPGRRAWLGAAATVGLAGALGGCTLLGRPSPIRMDLLHDDGACATTRAPLLLVLLPGANMTPEEMQREGMVQAVRQRHLAADVVIAHAHLGYVYDRSVMRRLHDDVVGPARAQGYERIWMAGISLGGFLAMGYALRHPGQIEGLVTLAPYLGRRQILQDIQAAGGPLAWRQTAQPREADDAEHALWMWLSATPSSAPPVYLGYGSEDRFAPAQRLMAGLLPPGQVEHAPGGHDWPPWRTLWDRWLDRGLLPTVCTA